MAAEVLTNAISPAVLEALAIGNLPDIVWQQDDDRCDCVYQRIGTWTNPYLAETLEVRFCCIWAELSKQYPDFVRTIPAYRNDNEHRWETTPQEWNGEAEMPKAIWYRHLARKLNRSLSEIRSEYSLRDHERPRGRKQSVPFVLLYEGQEIMVDLATWTAD